MYHHISDRQLREDESPATKSRNNLALLRKLVYNLIQLAKIDLKKQMGTSEWMDLFAGDPELQSRSHETTLVNERHKLFLYSFALSNGCRS